MRLLNYFLFFILVLFIFLIIFDNSNFYFLKKERILNFSQLLEKKELLEKIFKINDDNFKRENFIENKINILSPIINNLKKKEGVLTREGIINFTNKIRIENNLPPLKENEKLNQMAELKIKDMFENQYFSHQLANKKDISYLAEKIDYQYIKIGENLAKGFFQDDEELVLAWFNSPGHRANILNSKYKEIGVAVKKVFFQGELLWLAVQHFGTSLNYCQNENLKNLKDEINLKKEELDNLYNFLVEKEKYLNFSKNIYLEDNEFRNFLYNYNILVEKYNNLLKEVKNLIDIYNEEVKRFNECINFYQ